MPFILNYTIYKIFHMHIKVISSSEFSHYFKLTLGSVNMLLGSKGSK